jgi:hypothetical protein
MGSAHIAKWVPALHPDLEAGTIIRSEMRDPPIILTSSPPVGRFGRIARSEKRIFV